MKAPTGAYGRSVGRRAMPSAAPVVAPATSTAPTGPAAPTATASTTSWLQQYKTELIIGGAVLGIALLVAVLRR